MHLCREAEQVSVETCCFPYKSNHLSGVKSEVASGGEHFQPHSPYPGIHAP